MNKLGNYWKNILTSTKKVYYWEEPIIEFFKTRKGRRLKVLEIGVGYGRMIKAAKHHLPEGSIFFGLDKFVKNSLNDLNFVGGDARAIPFRSNSMDVVYSLGVIEHFPETIRSLSEHLRVVKPGQYILISTPRCSIFSPLRWLVYLLKYRRNGSFQETMGSNLRVKPILNYFSSQGCIIRFTSAEGIYLPLPVNFKKYLANRLPRSLFGAYLIIVAQK